MNRIHIFLGEKYSLTVPSGVVMSSKCNLAGKKFGHLTVLYESPQRDSHGSVMWVCECDCGNITPPLYGGNLRRGHTTSCGCKKLKHGQHYKKIYWVWSAMKKRCYNANHPTFKNYGARGIAVCKEWKDSFNAFYEWALSNGYQEAKQGECTLDRIDTNGDYCPENCRWVSMKVQQNNRRNNRK